MAARVSLSIQFLISYVTKKNIIFFLKSEKEDEKWKLKSSKINKIYLVFFSIIIIFFFSYKKHEKFELNLSKY